jgi:hypothetical protein
MLLKRSMTALASHRSISTLDQLAKTANSLPELAPDVTRALTGAVEAFRELTDQCQRHAIDPMPMLAAMMRGEQVSTIPAAEAPVQFDAVRWSHEFIEAFDRGDAQHVDTRLASAFVLFDSARARDRTAIIAAMLSGSWQSSVTSRAWLEEHVMELGGTAIVLAKVQEVPSGNDTHGGYRRDGWFLFQWSRAEGPWKLSLVTWQSDIASKAYFDDIFSKDRGFSHEPNQLLVETVASLAPGAALDLAMGQGRNALHLASLGWQVTGVDESSEALRVANDNALQRDLALEMVGADLDEWEMGENRYDLVTLIYAGDHGRWLERIKRALRPGGWFVLEGWGRVNPDDQNGFPVGRLRECFGDFEIVVDETLDAVPDWAHDQGRLVRFVARKRAA